MWYVHAKEVYEKIYSAEQFLKMEQLTSIERSTTQLKMGVVCIQKSKATKNLVDIFITLRSWGLGLNVLLRSMSRVYTTIYCVVFNS